jgi:hypothetical protein
MGQTVRPVIASGTIAAGELRISAVNGTAFIDLASDAAASANFVAAVANNDVIEISDSSKRKIIAYAKAQGTGETYTDIINGATLNGNMETGDPPTGWNAVRGTVASETGAGNFNSSPSAKLTTTVGQASSNIYREVNLVAGQCVKLSIYLKNGNATAIQSKIDPFTVGDSICNTGQINPAVITQYTKYGTQPVGNTKAYIYGVIIIGDGKYGYCDDVVLQIVLTPSNLGITLTNSPGGTTYNFGVKDSAFNYNDTSGYTYRILSSTAYSKLIATQSPVSGTLHIATVDGGAMFFHDSIDFSSYAGNDTDSTPYLFVFYDSTGKSAQAYAGAVGGGKALGAEINTGTLTLNTLYEITATEVNHFGTGLEVGEFFTSAGTETCDANNKVKAFTDIAATGLHLLSTKNGSTRNMKSVESGFNPLTITKVNIYRAL